MNLKNPKNIKKICSLKYLSCNLLKTLISSRALKVNFRFFV